MQDGPAQSSDTRASGYIPIKSKWRPLLPTPSTDAAGASLPSTGEQSDSKQPSLAHTPQSAASSSSSLERGGLEMMLRGDVAASVDLTQLSHREMAQRGLRTQVGAAVANVFPKRNGHDGGLGGGSGGGGGEPLWGRRSTRSAKHSTAHTRYGKDAPSPVDRSSLRQSGHNTHNTQSAQLSPRRPRQGRRSATDAHNNSGSRSTRMISAAMTRDAFKLRCSRAISDLTDSVDALLAQYHRDRAAKEQKAQDVLAARYPHLAQRGRDSAWDETRTAMRALTYEQRIQAASQPLVTEAAFCNAIDVLETGSGELRIWDSVLWTMANREELCGFSPPIQMLLRRVQQSYARYFTALDFLFAEVRRKLETEWSLTALQQKEDRRTTATRQRLGALSHELEKTLRSSFRTTQDILEAKKGLENVNKMFDGKEPGGAVAQVAVDRDTGELMTMTTFTAKGDDVWTNPESGLASADKPLWESQLNFDRIGRRFMIHEIATGSVTSGHTVLRPSYYRFTLSEEDEGVFIRLVQKGAEDEVNYVELSMRHGLPPTDDTMSFQVNTKGSSYAFLNLSESRMRPGRWYVRVIGRGSLPKAFSFELRIFTSVLDYSKPLNALLDDMHTMVSWDGALTDKMSMIQNTVSDIIVQEGGLGLKLGKKYRRERLVQATQPPVRNCFLFPSQVLVKAEAAAREASAASSGVAGSRKRASSSHGKRGTSSSQGPRTASRSGKRGGAGGGAGAGSEAGTEAKGSSSQASRSYSGKAGPLASLINFGRVFPLMRHSSVRGKRSDGKRTDNEGIISVRDFKTFAPVVVLRAIDTVYGEKMLADAIDDRQDNLRQSLAEFLYDHFKNKYGLTKLAERYLCEFLWNLQRPKIKDLTRVRMFGMFLGVFSPSYSSAELDFYLDAMDALRKSAVESRIPLADTSSGSCFVPAHVCVDSLNSLYESPEDRQYAMRLVKSRSSASGGGGAGKDTSSGAALMKTVFFWREARRKPRHSRKTTGGGGSNGGGGGGGSGGSRTVPAEVVESLEEAAPPRTEWADADLWLQALTDTHCMSRQVFVTRMDILLRQCDLDRKGFVDFTGFVAAARSLLPWYEDLELFLLWSRVVRKSRGLRRSQSSSSARQAVDPMAQHHAEEFTTQLLGAQAKPVRGSKVPPFCASYAALFDVAFSAGLVFPPPNVRQLVSRRWWRAVTQQDQSCSCGSQRIPPGPDGFNGRHSCCSFASHGASEVDGDAGAGGGAGAGAGAAVGGLDGRRSTASPSSPSKDTSVAPPRLLTSAVLPAPPMMDGSVSAAGLWRYVAMYYPAVHLVVGSKTKKRRARVADSSPQGSSAVTELNTAADATSSADGQSQAAHGASDSVVSNANQLSRPPASQSRAKGASLIASQLQALLKSGGRSHGSQASVSDMRVEMIQLHAAMRQAVLHAVSPKSPGVWQWLAVGGPWPEHTGITGIVGERIPPVFALDAADKFQWHQRMFELSQHCSTVAPHQTAGRLGMQLVLKMDDIPLSADTPLSSLYMTRNKQTMDVYDRQDMEVDMLELKKVCGVAVQPVADSMSHNDLLMGQPSATLMVAETPSAVSWYANTHELEARQWFESQLASRLTRMAPETKQESEGRRAQTLLDRAVTGVSKSQRTPVLQMFAPVNLLGGYNPALGSSSRSVFVGGTRGLSLRSLPATEYTQTLRHHLHRTGLSTVPLSQLLFGHRQLRSLFLHTHALQQFVLYTLRRKNFVRLHVVESAYGIVLRIVNQWSIAALLKRQKQEAGGERKVSVGGGVLTDAGDEEDDLNDNCCANVTVLEYQLRLGFAMLRVMCTLAMDALVSFPLLMQPEPDQDDVEDAGLSKMVGV